MAAAAHFRVQLNETGGTPAADVKSSMPFLRSYGLAVVSAAGVLMVMSYGRWMLNLSDTDRFSERPASAWISPVYILELLAGPVALAFFCALFSFFPVLITYALARYWKITNIAFYLLSGMLLACALSWLFLQSDIEGQLRGDSRSYLSVLIHFLPASLAGASVFWWGTRSD